MKHLAELFSRASSCHIPVNVSVELTHRCNLRCRHCYVPDLSRPDAVATPRLLELLEELVDMGTLNLTVTGGEPLLRRDWLSIVVRARELGFHVRLFSNATLITAAVAAELARLHVEVEVSVHAMEQQVFDRSTGVPGSFACAMAGIEALCEQHVTLKLKTPVTRCNVDHVGAVAEFARSIGAGFQSDARIVHCKDGGTGPIQERLSSSGLMTYYRMPETRFASLEDCGDGPAADSPMCGAATRTCNISASGEVLACPVMPGAAGNINHQSLHEIWSQSPWFEQLRAIRRKDLPECASCAGLAYCMRCPAQTLVEEGNLRAASRWACERAGLLESIAEQEKGA